MTEQTEDIIQHAVERSYSDTYVDRAVVLCQANGYPLTKGAVSSTARELDVPYSTLFAWMEERRRGPEAGNQTRVRLKDSLTDLMGVAGLTFLREALERRKEMSAYQLMIATGISTDKLVALTGGRGPACEDRSHAQIGGEASALGADEWR